MGKKETKIESLMTEYNAELYGRFASTVKFLLEQLLSQNGFRAQLVAARAKAPSSLRKKIKKNGAYSKMKSITELDDLAGCRIIFYIERDIERAIPLIQKDFKVVKDKLHYSTNSNVELPIANSDDNATEISNYNARHLIVNLKNDRLKLTEYSAFANLKCEIQLTTVLHHAWSELEHDVIYKPDPSLFEFAPEVLESIRERFTQVMDDHIKEAQRSFDYIFEELEKLKQGKKVFDKTFITSIEDATSNNAIHERLKLLLQYIEQYGDKTPPDIDIIKILRTALEKSKALPVEPVKTLLGEFDGRSFDDVVAVVLDILKQLRFVHLDKVFALLTELSTDESIKDRKKVFEVVEKMTEPVYVEKDKKIYFHAQLKVLDIMEKWEDSKLVTNTALIAEVGKHVLHSEFNASKWTSDSVKIGHGAIPVTDIVKKLRKRMIALLIKAYTKQENIKNKFSILEALQTATHTPMSANYGEDMETMVRDNLDEIVKFYISIAPSADLDVVYKIEKQLHWFKRRFEKDAPTNLAELDAVIQNNEPYLLYRVLVGYDGDYLPDVGFEESRKMRDEKIKEIVQDISETNYEEWLKKILPIIKNYPYTGERGEFNYFRKLLNEISKAKPKIGLKLLEEKALESFTDIIIAGIWCSTERKTAQDILNDWITQGKFLPAVAVVFEFVSEKDLPLALPTIKKLVKRAKSDGDVNTLNNLVRAIGFKKFQNSTKNLQSLLIDIIQVLTDLKNTWWVQNIWNSSESLFASLSKEEWKVVLDSLVSVPNLNYEAEEILFLVAKNDPKEFIQFFERRVKVKKKTKRDNRYDAIPFNFTPRQAGELSDLSEATKKVFVDEIFKWFKGSHWLNYWEGAHLLKNLFPQFDPYLESKLITLIKSKTANKARTAIAVLRAYEGEAFLHNACKEFIKQFPNNKKYQNEMFVILSQTGVVSGEYGFVDAYQAKITDVQSWKSDQSKVIKSFVASYEKHLNDRIVWEKKRADEDIDHRKREYGEK